MMRLPFLSALAAVSLAACAAQNPSTDAAATATPGAGRDCFLATSVNGYSYVDENHVSITLGPNRHYMLTTMFNASDLDWTQVIALRSRGNGWICTGNGLGVEVVGGRFRRPYPISAIERMPEQTPAPEGS